MIKWRTELLTKVTKLYNILTHKKTLTVIKKQIVVLHNVYYITLTVTFNHGKCNLADCIIIS